MPRAFCTAKMCDFGPHFEILQAGGFEVETVPADVDLRKEPHRVVEQVQGYEAVIAGAEPYTREVLEQLPDLKVISRYGVGYDAVDLEACDELGKVGNDYTRSESSLGSRTGICLDHGHRSAVAFTGPGSPCWSMGVAFNTRASGAAPSALWVSDGLARQWPHAPSEWA